MRRRTFLSFQFDPQIWLAVGTMDRCLVLAFCGIMVKVGPQ